MPLTKVKEKLQVTIPTEVRKATRRAVGDVLEATAKNNVIVLTPKAVVDREAVEAAIAEGLGDLEAGRVSPTFSDIKEFKKYLKAKRS